MTRKIKFRHKQLGFTVVEVMIVLAVASLILAIVFMAVPQLQRSQRNADRKNIALRLKAELEAFQANKQGVYPFGQVNNTIRDCKTSLTGSPPTCYDWYSTYVLNKFNIKDPSTGVDVGIFYTNVIATPTNSPWVAGKVFIVVGGYCNGTSVTGTAGSETSKQYAMLLALETQNNWSCTDNR